MLWVLIRSASLRRFWWVPTTYIFMEKWEKYQLDTSSYLELCNFSNSFTKTYLMILVGIPVSTHKISYGAKTKMFPIVILVFAMYGDMSALEVWQNMASWHVTASWSGSPGLDPCRIWQHISMAIDYEIIAVVILSLPLIQDGQLSVCGERMCTNTG